MTNHRYDLLDIKELAGAIHKSVRWIQDCIKGCFPSIEPIPHIRLGNLFLFRPSEIDEWLDRHREVDENSPVVKKAEDWYRGVLERKSQVH